MYCQLWLCVYFCFYNFRLIDEATSLSIKMVPLCLTVLLLILHIAQACQYPEFLQMRRENGTKREWHTHITYHGRENLKHYALATHFHWDRMRVLVYGGEKATNRPKHHTRQCLFQYSATRYLSSHLEDGTQAKKKYICMEFLQRSSSIFQLAESDISDVEDFNLCNDDRMKLVHWIYVDKVNMYNGFESCPLTGGFSMFMYDQEHTKGVCDTYKGETRIEVQCEEGEGMRFLFRYHECIPKHIHMQTNQLTHCLASWQHGSYMFTVLKHQSTEHLWCFRFPYTDRLQLRAYLFKNLYCDMEQIPEEKAVVSFDMVKDSARGMDNLCMDDYEGCSYWDQPCTGFTSKTELICAKTCKVCDAHDRNKRPDRCMVPSNFQGFWADKRDQSVSITSIGMIMGKKDMMHCIDWQRRQFDDGMEYVEQMFVRTYDNGCRPRYSCVQLKKQSPSVLRLKVSEGQIWPFEGINSNTVDCGSFTYENSIAPHFDNFQSKYFKTLISQMDIVYVNCQLEPATRKFEVIFEGGQKCKGMLTQEGLENDRKMKLTLDKCAGRQSEQEFACLDSIKHIPYSQHLIVTETLDFQDSRIQCWLFPSHPGDLFYLISVTECNEVAHERINRGITVPTAIFKDRHEISISINVDYSKAGPSGNDGHGKFTYSTGKSTSSRVTELQNDQANPGSDDVGSIYEGGNGFWNNAATATFCNYVVLMAWCLYRVILYLP